MGREVRMVPKDWKHPTDNDGDFVPLLSGYTARLARFTQMVSEKGEEYAISYFGAPPDKAEHMPDFDPDAATHWMMYETCSEGTPISPAFATKEELARWLADTGASAFGPMRATYEQWLATCTGGSAPSAVLVFDSNSARVMSGVEGMAKGGA